MKKLYKVLKRLKENLPTTHPVLVYIVDPNKMKDRWGECYFTGKRFVIRLGRADYGLMMFILCHEYAHCLCSPDLPEEEWHGEEWGRAYARVWRVYSREVVIESSPFPLQ